MDYSLLGPLEVRQDGRPVAVPAAKHRVVLATLLLSPNEVVHADVIAEHIWGNALPAGARKTVQGYVARLRKILGGDAIVTRPPGYAVVVPDGALDLHRFEALTEEANRVSHDPERRSALLSSALAIWRGAPLSNVPSEHVQQVDVVQLTERRLHALGERIEADLALGRHTELISELRELVNAHPFNEGFAGQLIIALHRAGRRADALQVYRTTRQVLVDEVGVEPGALLQELHQQILTSDTDTPAEPPQQAPMRLTRPTQAPHPSQLPLDIPDFVGRDEEIQMIKDHFLRPRSTGGPPAVVCVAGSGGIGKTTLAVHAGNRLQDLFPDGRLYVNLSGEDEHPVNPHDVLANFLQSLGMDAGVLPATLQDRSALFRSLTAKRKILLVLDNAFSEAQVRPLLPAHAEASVIITSRRMLAGIAGARHLELSLFSADEAVALLTSITGPAKVEAEPERAREIAMLCGRLPLAVRIAGARMVARPYHELSWLAARLASEHNRLNELAVGDLVVRANIGLSYVNLDHDAQRAFRLLSTIEARSFSLWAAEAVLGLDTMDAQEVLDTLVDHRMLEAVRQDCVRYQFHDLVLLFAREQSGFEDTAEDRGNALARLLARGKALTGNAVRQLGLTPLTVPPSPADDDEERAPVTAPLTWLDQEHATLVTCIGQAADEQLDQACLDLAWTLWPYLYLRAYFDSWRVTVDSALRAAERLRDARAYAICLSSRGSLHEARGQHRMAVEDLARSVRTFELSGDAHGAARAKAALALERGIEGDYRTHQRLSEEAVRELRLHGDSGGEAIALHHLSIAQRELGDIHAARDSAAQSAALFAELGDAFGEARARSALMEAEVLRGDFAAAAEHNSRWFRLCQSNSDRRGEAYARQARAELSLRQGDTIQARAALEPALRTAEELHWRLGLPLVLYTFGELCRAEGDFDEGIRHLERAEKLWEQNNYTSWQARALVRLAGLYDATGRTAGAIAARRKAYELLSITDSPDAAGLHKRAFAAN